MKKELILSQRDVRANPLDPPLGHNLNLNCLALRLCFVKKCNTACIQCVDIKYFLYNRFSIQYVIKVVMS